MSAYALDQQHTTRLRVRVVYELGELFYRFLLVPLIAFLPAPLAYRIACLRGDWCYRQNTVLREQILANLEGVLGEQLTPSQRVQVARDFFRRRSCEPLDVMRLAGKGRALARLVDIRGLEHITSALAAGKGAIICSAHFGSFNSCFSLIGASGFPVITVGDWRTTYDSSMTHVQKRLWQLVQQKPLARHRHRPNIEPARERFGTAIRMAEILRSNEVLTMALETPLPVEDRQRAIPVDFLGRHVALLPGSVQIAHLTSTPMFVMVAYRLPDWYHQRVEIAPIEPLDNDITTTLRQCAAMLEAPMHQHLAHWDYWGSTRNLIELGLLPAQEEGAME